MRCISNAARTWAEVREVPRQTLRTRGARNQNAAMCEAVASLGPRTSAVAPHVAAGLGKPQGDFAGEPLVAPIKTHLTPELACDYVFHNARAEAAVRGWRDGRPVCLDPAQTEPSVCRRVRNIALDSALDVSDRCAA